MRKKVLRLALVLLALLMCFSMIACQTPEQPPAGGDTPGDETPGGNLTDPPEEVLDRYNVPDSLPEKGEVSFEQEFHIAYGRDSILPTYWVLEDSGGAVDKAVFSAIARTEERFGVTITAAQGGSGDQGHVDFVRNQILGGKTDFDIAHVHDSLGGALSLEGAFLNLYDIEEFDFSKPWWPEKVVNTMTYMDQLYLISNSMSYNQLSSATCLFFNKGMMEDLGLALPYETVTAGDWTWEIFLTYVEDLHEDTDSSEDKSVEDTFGFLVDDLMYWVMETFGVEMVYKDDNGNLALHNDPKMLMLIENLYDVVYDSDGGYLGARKDVKKMFGEGQGLFFLGAIGQAVSDFSSYDIDYGIIPVPKLDETQEDYISAVADFFFVIPNTCTDTNFVGTIIESMSAEGYRTVTPVYFDKVLKDRYSKDTESKAMVDLIQDNMYMSIDYLFGNGKWYSRSVRGLIFGEHSKDFASYYAETEEAALEQIQFVIGQYDYMKNLQ